MSDSGSTPAGAKAWRRARGRGFVRARFLAGFAGAAVAAACVARAAAAEPKSAGSPWGPFVEEDFPFFSSVLDAREASDAPDAGNLTPRGLILNLGRNQWACFDVDLLRVSALWVGDAVTPVSMAQGSYHVAGHKAPEGQDALPRVRGEVWLTTGLFPGCQVGERFEERDPRDTAPDPREAGRGPLPEGTGRFRQLSLAGDGVDLEYEIGGARVTERMVSAQAEGGRAVRRMFRVAGAGETLWIAVGRVEGGRDLKVFLEADERGIVGRVELVAPPDPGRPWLARVSAGAGEIEFSVVIAEAGAAVQAAGERVGEKGVSPRRWPQEVLTAVRRSPDTAAYVLDPVDLPIPNPWRRNVRLADLGFFSDGRAAAVTFDGDVWIIEGLGASAKQVSWRRFASGLHEPLGLAIRDDEVFAHDRNGIWRLLDRDANGEADRHELFSNAFAQTAETREFASGLRLAPDGSWVIGMGGQRGSTVGRHSGTVLRISADGSSVEVLGRGLRQPFIGVHPKTGLVTASDQQGHYIPTTALHVIEGGQYYGFLPLVLPKNRHPAPIAEPFTWIPHPVNASGAGQVWMTGEGMGPLKDGLAHLGYYRPEVFVTLLNRRASALQGAVVSLTREIGFPPLAGATHPLEGRPYFVGFQIWGTTAPQVSGMARLRYTGRPFFLPVEVAAMEKGVLLRFDVELDPAAATNVSNYSAERWNYQRTPSYGSPHYRLDGTKGQEPMSPSSAYLSLDRRSVFVGLPDMRPVMQMRLGWALRSAGGDTFEDNAYFTPRVLTKFEAEAEGFDSLEVDLTPRPPPERLEVEISAAEGRRLSELMGCVACHSTDGSTLGRTGPSWKGLFGSVRRLAGGGSVVADRNYLRESIQEPAAKVVEGFQGTDTGMPSYQGVLAPEQVESLVLYLETLR